MLFAILDCLKRQICECSFQKEGGIVGTWKKIICAGFLTAIMSVTLISCGYIGEKESREDLESSDSVFTTESESVDMTESNQVASESVASTVGDMSGSVESSDADETEDFTETETVTESDSDISESENVTETKTECIKHNYDSDSRCENITCTVCGYVKEQEHNNYVVSKQSATLISDGFKEYKCRRCGYTEHVKTDKIAPTETGMPVIYITDRENKSLADLQKSDGRSTFKIKYSSDGVSFVCSASINVQGATSAGYPKKNYTVRLYTDETLTDKYKVDLGWGKESKYCLKANYIDSSQARNIVAAQMFAQVVQSRKDVSAGIAKAPNYGVVDGYPVLLYLNGEFHGLYTLNIPKDEWMFAMKKDSTEKQAILMASSNDPSCALCETIDGKLTGWSLEYCSTENTDTSWVCESFNELIELVNCGDKERICTELKEHLDIEAAMDCMIFAYFINGADNDAKNIIWVTYDGKIWIPSMYDMDGTFGIWWNGKTIGEPDTVNSYPTVNADGTVKLPAGSYLYSVLVECFPDELEARYRYLREDILTVENTRTHFEAFFSQIPNYVYRSDFEKWQDIPCFSVNRSNMYSATEEQLKRIDSFFYNFNKK